MGGRVSTRLALTFTPAFPFIAALTFASDGEGGVSDLRVLVGPPFLAFVILLIRKVPVSQPSPQQGERRAGQSQWLLPWNER